MGPEKIFENKIKKLIISNGGWYVKFFANRMTKSGIPDILACVNGRFVAIEVKADNGIVKPLQEHTIKEIRNADGLSYIVYPSGFNKLKKVIENLNNEIFNISDAIILK